jgi:hypothetical protein
LLVVEVAVVVLVVARLAQEVLVAAAMVLTLQML